MKKAFITGVTGQDGSYLVELLLEKGYEVHGIVRRTSSLERSRLSHLYADPAVYNRTLRLHYADLEDTTSLRRLLVRIAPEEIYHLAGQSHVGLSFEIPEATCEMTAMATLRLLEIVRDLPGKPRLFHPASSEIFGRPEAAPQDETTPFRPVSPYGCAKAFAANMVRLYRDTFGLHASNGIFYNHESPRRGENFVTRKICRGAAEVKTGRRERLVLGNLDARRDWGYAPDMVRAMWLMLQQEQPDDYVCATGVTHSVRDLAAAAFGAVGLDWQAHVETDPALLRPGEPADLVGNPAKARERLGWAPTLGFAEMIRVMTLAEVKALDGN